MICFYTAAVGGHIIIWFNKHPSCHYHKSVEFSALQYNNETEEAITLQNIFLFFVFLIHMVHILIKCLEFTNQAIFFPSVHRTTSAISTASDVA